MSRLSKTVNVIAALAAMTLIPGAQAADNTKLTRGKQLYQAECASCHGVEGDGEGPGAYILSQKPRNFQLGVFKIRSTPSGEFPTDQDLFNSITRGLAGGNGAMMPSFAAYSEADRWALVEVVKQFAEIDAPGKPISVPSRPANKDIILGKQVYAKLECQNCHGSDGVGDGTSSLTLEDDLEERIWVPDLTRGVFKGGDSPAAIYTRIMTGLDGSPMPAYGDKATSKEAWALTEYVLSLSAPD